MTPPNRTRANKAAHTNPLPAQSRIFQMIKTLNPESTLALR